MRGDHNQRFKNTVEPNTKIFSSFKFIQISIVNGLINSCIAIMYMFTMTCIEVHVKFERHHSKINLLSKHKM